MAWKLFKKEEAKEKPVRSFSVDGIKGIISRNISRKERKILSTLTEKELDVKIKESIKPQEREIVNVVETTPPKEQRVAEERSKMQNPEEEIDSFSSSPVDPRIIEIEDMLSDGLEDMFFKLPQNLQQEFKQKGEEAAKKIYMLLQDTKIKIGKIFQIIVNWLKLLPGVNRLFVEQEAKIKLDKILEWKAKQE